MTESYQQSQKKTLQSPQMPNTGYEIRPIPLKF